MPHAGVHIRQGDGNAAQGSTCLLAAAGATASLPASLPVGPSSPSSMTRRPPILSAPWLIAPGCECGRWTSPTGRCSASLPSSLSTFSKGGEEGDDGDGCGPEARPSPSILRLFGSCPAGLVRLSVTENCSVPSP